MNAWFLTISCLYLAVVLYNVGIFYKLSIQAREHYYSTEKSKRLIPKSFRMTSDSTLKRIVILALIFVVGQIVKCSLYATEYFLLTFDSNSHLTTIISIVATSNHIVGVPNILVALLFELQRLDSSFTNTAYAVNKNVIKFLSFVALLTGGFILYNSFFTSVVTTITIIIFSTCIIFTITALFCKKLLQLTITIRSLTLSYGEQVDQLGDDHVDKNINLYNSSSTVATVKQNTQNISSDANLKGYISPSSTNGTTSPVSTSCGNGTAHRNMNHSQTTTAGTELLQITDTKQWTNTDNNFKNMHDTYQMQIDMKNANRLSPLWSSGGNLDTTSNEGSDNDIQDIENEAGDTLSDLNSTLNSSIPTQTSSNSNSNTSFTSVNSSSKTGNKKKKKSKNKKLKRASGHNYKSSSVLMFLSDSESLKRTAQKLTEKQRKLINLTSKQTLLSFVLFVAFLCHGLSTVITLAFDEQVVFGNDDSDSNSYKNIIFVQCLLIFGHILMIIAHVMFPLAVWLSFVFAKQEYQFLCNKFHLFCVNFFEKCATVSIQKMKYENERAVNDYVL